MAPRKPRVPPGRPPYPGWPWGQPVVTPDTQASPVIFGPLVPQLPINAPSHLPIFPAGYGPGNDMDSLITTPLKFCAQGVVFRALLAGGQVISGATATVLGFDTILEDPFGGWSAAGTGTQAANSWQPPFDGIYEITVSVNSAAGAVTNLVAGVGVTGAQFNPLGSTSATAGTSGGAQGSIMKALAGGADYIRGYTWGSPGFSLATAGDPRDTSMEIVFVSE